MLSPAWPETMTTHPDTDTVYLSPNNHGRSKYHTNPDCPRLRCEPLAKPRAALPTYDKCDYCDGYNPKGGAEQ